MVELCLKAYGKWVNVNGSPCQVKANLSFSVPNIEILKNVTVTSTVAIHVKACSLRKQTVSVIPAAAVVSRSAVVFGAL